MRDVSLHIADHVFSGLRSRGSTPELEDLLYRKDWIQYNVVRMLRRYKMPKPIAEEANAAALMVEHRYYGTPSAFLYFGEETKSNYAAIKKTLLHQVLPAIGGMKLEVLMKKNLVWIPPLSLDDIIKMLPKGYFYDAERWDSALFHNQDFGDVYDWAKIKMQPGFRLFDLSEPEVDVLESYEKTDGVCMPDPTEMVYWMLMMFFEWNSRPFGGDPVGVGLHYAQDKPNVKSLSPLQFFGWTNGEADNAFGRDELGFHMKNKDKFPDLKPKRIFVRRYLLD